MRDVEFTVRRDVRFHDGEWFDANAVRLTLDYLQDPKNKTHYLPRFKRVQSVEVVNDDTVRRGVRYRGRAPSRLAERRGIVGGANEKWLPLGPTMWTHVPMTWCR